MKDHQGRQQNCSHKRTTGGVKIRFTFHHWGNIQMPFGLGMGQFSSPRLVIEADNHLPTAYSCQVMGMEISFGDRFAENYMRNLHLSPLLREEFYNRLRGLVVFIQTKYNKVPPSRVSKRAKVRFSKAVENLKEKIGAGVIMTKEGAILTCSRVVQDNLVSVKFSFEQNMGEFLDATLVCRDKNLDLTILLPTRKLSRDYAMLSPDERVDVGMEVFTVSHPTRGCMKYTFSCGEVTYPNYRLKKEVQPEEGRSDAPFLHPPSHLVKALRSPVKVFFSTPKGKTPKGSDTKSVIPPGKAFGISEASYQKTSGMQTVDDSINTSISVGGLNDSVSTEQLRQIFSPYGQLVHVKVLVGEGCGFVQFADSHCAEVALKMLNGIALKMLNGTQLGGQNIRLSWGRSPSNEQTQLDPNQWNSGSYGYQRGYETGGCVRSIQGPNMYYGSYLDMEITSKPPNSSRSSSISRSSPSPEK
ncbi:hypothetical protein Vadar_003817 [Vaccinium darrowii]|uniref:Uncharacterized protein n=1 Tax=Vaccinium darrowii TaxID=229202 RepID=A0ACB7ZH32_9ERIC|nr:hypothetical protein Vadar_003817 [Vaccinium darrowii]